MSGLQELLEAQHEGVARQDGQLDRVEAAVGRVQAQAQAVHGEVRSLPLRAARVWGRATCSCHCS